ncbi:hypothetical protein PUN28_000686 [Cardiocondyla obscurior]|uniref:Uncharacterized protein n=1 Tax=Cardiocondyla obscurior TaxID=286306 RepID=A0AAW2H0Z9_9HYME
MKRSLPITRCLAVIAILIVCVDGIIDTIRIYDRFGVVRFFTVFIAFNNTCLTTVLLILKFDSSRKSLTTRCILWTSPDVRVRTRKAREKRNRLRDLKTHLRYFLSPRAKMHVCRTRRDEV